MFDIIYFRQPVRVPTPPGKSWIFFIENARTWKVLENHFGPGKSWKNILESHVFFPVVQIEIKQQ